jgi:hypothetical protein
MVLAMQLLLDLWLRIQIVDHIFVLIADKLALVKFTSIQLSLTVPSRYLGMTECDSFHWLRAQLVTKTNSTT